MLHRDMGATQAQGMRRTGRSDVGSDGLSVSERTYRQIREKILSGELARGTRLVEATLAAQCGVSRTPVSQALKRLLEVNLVEADPLRGLVVRAPEPAEVEDAYVVREVLDGLAARLAAKRLTTDDERRLRFVQQSMSDGIDSGRVEVIVGTNIAFHDLLYGIAGNQTLRQLGTNLREYVRRVSSEAFTDMQRARGVLAEHEAILEALVQGDPDKAERVSREHLHNARMNLSLRHVQAIVDGSDRVARSDAPTPIGSRPRPFTLGEPPTS
jgi:DNA-binding GntR family transcriptional regulator